MEQGRMILITGSPGTGKTTVASLVAQQSDFARSVHLRVDAFFGFLSKGAILPQIAGSQRQNRIVLEAALEAAKRYVRGGYEVVVDGVIGPWFLEPWVQAARSCCEIHYIVLRASKAETMRRALGRHKLDSKMNAELVETMWGQWNALGRYEQNVIDTTEISAAKCAASIQEAVRAKSHLLAPLQPGSPLE